MWFISLGKNLFLGHCIFMGAICSLFLPLRKTWSYYTQGCNFLTVFNFRNTGLYYIIFKEEIYSPFLNAVIRCDIIHKDVICSLNLNLDPRGYIIIKSEICSLFLALKNAAYYTQGCDLFPVCSFRYTLSYP